MKGGLLAVIQFPYLFFSLTVSGQYSASLKLRCWLLNLLFHRTVSVPVLLDFPAVVCVAASFSLTLLAALICFRFFIVTCPFCAILPQESSYLLFALDVPWVFSSMPIG